MISTIHTSNVTGSTQRGTAANIAAVHAAALYQGQESLEVVKKL